MNKKQKIHWSKSNVGEEQTIQGILGSVSALSGMLLDAVCALLFIYSSRLILKDVFDYKGCDATNMFTMILAALGVSVAMEIARCYKDKKRYGMYIGVLLVGVVLCWFATLTDNGWENICKGFEVMISDYSNYWNSYFGSSKYIPPLKDNEIQLAKDALDFASFALLYLFIWQAKLRRDNISTIIVPLAFFVAGLLVGYAPKEASMFLTFIAALLSNAHRWSKPAFKLARKQKSRSIGGFAGNGISSIISSFSWILLAVVIGIVCLLTAGIGEKPAKKVVANAKEFKVSVNELIEDIKNGDYLEVLGIMVGTPTRSKLTNDPIKYKNEVVIQLTISERYAGNMYLKGFQANTYKNGVWTEELGSLNSALKKQGLKKNDFTRELASLGTEKIIDNFYAEDLYDTDFGAILKIKYKKKADSRAYMPYFAEVDDKNITVKGEGLYIKRNNISSTELVVWMYGGMYDTRTEFFSDEELNDWEVWYNLYVTEAYTEVPDSLQNTVEVVASEIRAMTGADYIKNDNNLINIKRLNNAFKVARWMAKNTTYTLEPPNLPEGEDPIEYFLTDSYRGYCMHYASAATMILREMGVPARYVTGYVVDSSVFTKNEDSDVDTFKDDVHAPSMIDGETTIVTYEADVMDNMAHAWVEIYLEGIGWVPVEVTKGYNDEAIMQNNSNNQTQQPTTPEPTTPEPTTPEPTTPEPTTTPEETTTEDTSEDVSNPENETTTAKPSGNKNGASKTIGSLFKMLKILVPVVLVASVIGWLVYNLYKNHAQYVRKLESDINNKRTRKVIRKVNRRIYKKLRRSGRILKTSITDDEYNSILKKTYPHIEPIDWNRFINIAKAASFSTAEFTVEEMNFCLKIWDMVDSKSKN